MSKRSEALKNMRQQTLMKNMTQAPQQNNHDEPLVGILNAIASAIFPPIPIARFPKLSGTTASSIFRRIRL